MIATTTPIMIAVKKQRDMSLGGACEYECV